eukprot:4441645-Pyramimonas_sp.AAC.1
MCRPKQPHKSYLHHPPPYHHIPLGACDVHVATSYYVPRAAVSKGRIPTRSLNNAYKQAPCSATHLTNSCYNYLLHPAANPCETNRTTATSVVSHCAVVGLRVFELPPDDGILWDWDRPLLLLHKAH